MTTPARLQDNRMTVLVQRIEGEFREMPGLRLTRWQAARLWSLEQGECEAVLQALIDARIIRETGNGFVRRES